MREIKFRATVNGDKRVWDVLAIDWLNKMVLLDTVYGYLWKPMANIDKLLQFIGLLDRKNNEIYEEDFVIHELQDAPERKIEIRTVVWWRGGFCFRKPGDQDGCDTALDLSKIEVHNAHNNPKAIK